MAGKVRTRKFQAETRKLLDLMIHSVYSRQDVFLRELISNASDAIDKLRFLALTDPALADLGQDFEIRLRPNEAAGTLSVIDNGIGMDEDEVIANLGTIARSGSAAFLAAVTGAEGAEAGADLIGQFGVGFYSAFMVADRVTVVTQREGAEHALRWSSAGGDDYTIERLPPQGRGTAVTLQLKRGADRDLPDSVDFEEGAPAELFTQPWRLRQIVKTHSDFIAYPIVLETPAADEARAGSAGSDLERETLNSMRPLWTRRKEEIAEAEYHEFYHHLTHDPRDPFEVIHAHVEGSHEYTALLYLPAQAPFDLYAREHRRGLRLYARRVFIMEECREIMPEHLRFVRGLVDSPDFPLNISREMVQQDRLIAAFGRQLHRRVLDTLRARMERDRPGYEAFWSHFGAVLKEGLHYEPGQSQAIGALCLFRSTAGEGWVSLAEYAARMPEGQTAIYYLTGEDLARLRQAPQLEVFRARGVEVLLLSDPVDELVVANIGGQAERPLVSAARGDLDLSGIPAPAADESAEAVDTGADASAAPAPENLRPLLDHLAACLGGAVESLRVSSRLTDSAVCLVSAEEGLPPHMARLLRSMGEEVPEPQRILELNPKHPLILRLYAIHQVNPADPRLAAAAPMLLDQALLAEGAPLPDPAAFARSVAELMAKAV